MTRKTKRKRKRKRNKKNITRRLKIKCSPKEKNETLPYTCYTAKGLHKIKNIWNKKHPDRKITSNRPRNIWKALHYVLNTSCNKETCWLRHKAIKNDIDLETKEYTFAPEAPKEWKENPTEWLTSIDILEVMKQYEKTYNCYEFIGPSPIDYDKHIACSGFGNSYNMKNDTTITTSLSSPNRVEYTCYNDSDSKSFPLNRMYDYLYHTRNYIRCPDFRNNYLNLHFRNTNPTYYLYMNPYIDKLFALCNPRF